MITNNQKTIIMERKIKKVMYAEGHRLSDGVLVPINKEKEIMLTGTKRFHNCLYLILGLKKLERILIDWLSEEMDNDNMIRNEKYTRAQFIKFVEGLVIDGDKKTYEDASVNNAMSALKLAGLLIPVTRGRLRVNPEYYWRGSDKDRVDAIMMNIQFKSNESYFKVYQEGSKVEVRRKGK